MLRECYFFLLDFVWMSMDAFCILDAILKLFKAVVVFFHCFF